MKYKFYYKNAKYLCIITQNSKASSPDLSNILINIIGHDHL